MAIAAQPRFYIVRWMVAGAVIGALATMVTWRVAGAGAGDLTFAELHDAYPMLWIVDLAPSVLGLAGAVIGILFSRIALAKMQIEESAQEIAASWIADLHASNVELATALDARSSFHTAVTHELRTPLATILGFTGIAANAAADDAELAEYLAEISGAAESMQGLVDDLLDAAKLEAHGIPLEITFVPCEEAIREAVGRLMPLARQKGLRVEVQVAEGLACRADPVRLRQILTNLVSNAIKYSDEGTIAISAFQRMNGTPVIAVRDEGVGIAADRLQSIFGAFDTGAVGARRDSTGLGLAISDALSRAMDAELAAHSDGPGHGSTFRLTLRPPNHQGVEHRMAQLVPGTAAR